MNKSFFCVFSFFFVLASIHGGLHGSEVKVKKTPDGWRLIVDGSPYFIKGVCYSPTKVGEDPSQATWRDWMIVDDDQDGRIDAPYQAWVDKNRNNQRDSDELEVGDFKLLQEMGCNTIRVYHHASARPEAQRLHYGKANSEKLYNHAPNKELLRDLFNTYGIRVAMGDFLGAYTVSSPASWDQGTDYSDPVQRKALLKSVEVMVKDHKDEPYLLLWILGNENVYQDLTHTNAQKVPEHFATLVNQAAKLIHKLDGKHPVALANGDTRLLKMYATHLPDLDIFGANVYRGPGFGFFWKEVQRKLDKPILITEYGTSHPRIIDGQVDEDHQALEHDACWRDIEKHATGNHSLGVAIGGFVFEWVDQWWFFPSPFVHNLNSNKGAENPEAHGIASQGDGSLSPTLRQLRKVYSMYQSLWRTK